MGEKGISSSFGGAVAAVGFFSYKGFSDFNELQFFQGFDVRSQVPIGQMQHFFYCRKITPVLRQQ